jgi:hypothetical protein
MKSTYHWQSGWACSCLCLHTGNATAESIYRNKIALVQHKFQTFSRERFEGGRNYLNHFCAPILNTICQVLNLLTVEREWRTGLVSQVNNSAHLHSKSINNAPMNHMTIYCKAGIHWVHMSMWRSDLWQEWKNGDASMSTYYWHIYLLRIHTDHLCLYNPQIHKFAERCVQMFRPRNM